MTASVALRKRVPYWRLSGFYFFYFSTLGGFLPYWGLYLQAEGFSPKQIGELMAILVGTKVIAPNIWGWIADHTGRGMGVIRVASFFAAMVFAGVYWASGYLWMAAVILIFSFFWNAALPQFEAVTLAHLHEDAHGYSRIRLWGSVGFIVSVMSVGAGLDYFPIRYLPALLVALLACIWLNSLMVPDRRVSHDEESSVRLRDILLKPSVAAFFVVFMLVQMAHGPYYVFFSIHLGASGYSGIETGGLWALGVCAEILLFMVMHRLLECFSLRGILLVSVFLGVVRWLVIGWGVDSLPLLLGAQLLHAATFGSSHAVAVHLVHHYFGSRHQGKGQALYSSLSFGLGGMVGSLYSGFLWSAYGAEVVFSIAAASCLLAFFIAWLWVDRDGPRERRDYQMVSGEDL